MIELIGNILLWYVIAGLFTMNFFLDIQLEPDLKDTALVGALWPLFVVLIVYDAFKQRKNS